MPENISDALKRLKAPAIGLLVTGALSMAMGAMTIVSGLLRLAGLMGKGPRIKDDAEQLGYFIGMGVSYGAGIFSMIAAPFIIFGAARMMKGQNRGLSMTAAILSILPITCCSFPLGVIFGIWALVVLMNPEVKDYFAGASNQSFSPPPPPPQPPQNWQ